MIAYGIKIWQARYFWTHLALADLRAKWRRSFFGILWSIIQPLSFTILLAVILGKMFHVEIREYAPYILSGIIIWDFVTACTVGGSVAFIQSDAYIKQYRHPLAIYTLRTVLTNTIVLAIASLSLVAWVLIVMPQNFGWCWLAALSIFPILILIAWPLATLLAYITTRFRDLQHALALFLQAMWFVSPIYFKVSFFRHGGMNKLIDYNPIYHLLEIVRAPLLNGTWPTLTNYAYCLGTILVLVIAAWLLGLRAERKVIFYL